MLGLVLADNLFQMFIFWELVGLCSYLLIGFWFHKPSAAAAAKKAFIVTRIGDLGLLAALLLVWTRAGTFDVTAIQEWATSGEPEGYIVTLFALGLFAGAAGKSAQFPLHVWLPDAMEGPTPVSALIHAATMVAAGVYLVARSYLLFFASPDHGALTVVAYVGGLTALMAATIGVVQNDIKRVMAYSTISQLGYMMMGLGVLGYTAGIFHLMTHAFFKALLFLAAGSVIHAMNTNDMKEMGGLASVMPRTYWTMLIGSLALAGVPPFAGFWSKDEILLEAFHNNPALFWIGLAGAFITAFYIFRMMFMTFGGRLRSAVHPHESPAVMTVPLLVLAGFSAVIGFVGAPWWGNPFHHFVSFEAAEGVPFDLTLALISTVVAGAGIFTAAAVYHWQWVPSESLRRAAGPLYTLLVRKYYWDEFYQWTVVRPLMWMARRLRTFDVYVIDGAVNAVGMIFVWLARFYRIFDLYVVDGAVNLVGWVTKAVGGVLRYAQTGAPQNYLLAIALGVILLIVGGIIR